MADNTFTANIKRLRRYFQGKTVIVPDGRTDSVRLRTVDPSVTAMDHMWNIRGNNASLGLFGGYNRYLTGQQHRIFLYQEYNMMERDPIISRALDVLSEESCLPNEYGNIIEVQSDNENIKTSLDYLFHEVLNVDHSLGTWVRQLIKYGDMFVYLNIKDQLGVVDAIPLSSVDVERHEDGGKYQDEVYFTANGIFTKNIPQERMVHFRRGKDSQFLPYGVSLLEPIRRHWKQLTLLEDFLMVYYLLRSVNQRVYRVDVGALAPKDVPSFMEKFQAMLKKQPLVDPESGEYDLNYDPLTVIDDVVIPIREGYINTEFDEIPASSETNLIEGIDYYRKKIMAGLGVPNFLLNYEEQINAKATASSEDIRFAKTVINIQKLILAELEQIAVIHLILQGYSKKDIYSFELSLTPPSDLKEMEELDKIDRRLDVATKAWDSGLFDKKFIYTNILKIGEEEFEEIMDNMLRDKIRDKLDEETINNTEIPDISASEEDIEADIDGDSDGEGSQGGQLQPPSGQDDAQQESDVGRVEDLLSARQSEDGIDRGSREPDDRSRDE